MLFGEGFASQAGRLVKRFIPYTFIYFIGHAGGWTGHFQRFRKCMAYTFRITTTEMADTKDKLYILAQKLRRLEFPITVIMDTAARFSTMRTWGSTAFGVSIYNESIRMFLHVQQLYTRRGTFFDYG